MAKTWTASFPVSASRQSLTVAKMLSLDNIKALAVATEYGGDITLSSLSAATLLSAAEWINQFGNWYGAGFELTQSERNEIRHLVAELINEVLTGESTSQMDYEKIAEVVHTSDTTEIEIEDMDTTDYSHLKIIVSGMLSDYGASWADTGILQLNELTTNTPYDSYGRFWYTPGPVEAQHLGNRPGIVLVWAIASDPPNGGMTGNLEITIYNSGTDERKRLMYDGMISGRTAAELPFYKGQGFATLTDR